MEQNEITALTLPVIETEIRSAYAEANALALTAKGNARAAVLRMADCGQMLMVAKDHIKGNRNEWLESLGIDADKAAKAIHLARNRDQLELDLWPADMAKLGAQMLGILPPPGSSGREENDPERTTGASTHWLTYAGKLQRSVADLFARKPMEQWRHDERESLRVAIKPIAELYAKLNA
jgi:hypothetical protein